MWYLLPGMGATSVMYDALKEALSFEVRCLDWPAYQGETTFREVAERLIADHQIQPGDVIGGSSLGGMIALEIAKILDSKAVILMGSALCPGDINPLLLSLSPLARCAPFSLFQFFAGRINHVLCRMFVETHPAFMRAMCLHMPAWPGYQGSMDKIFRIHGQRDLVIFCPRSGCEVVPGAGHLVAMTRAKVCAAWLESSRRRIE